MGSTKLELPASPKDHTAEIMCPKLEEALVKGQKRSSLFQSKIGLVCSEVQALYAFNKLLITSDKRVMPKCYNSEKSTQ